MTFDIDKASKIVDLAIKAEIHAVLMLFAGAAMVIHGQKDVGQGIVMAALAIFKGKSNS